MPKGKFDLDLEDDENTIEVDDEDLNEGDESDEEDESEEGFEEGDDEADGEGQDEGSEDEDGQEEDEEPRRVARGERRIQTLNNKRREAEARAQRLESEQAELRRQISELTNRGSAQQQADRQAYLDSLSPEQRAAYLAQEAVQANNAQIKQLEFKMQDNADRTEFEAKFSHRNDLAKLMPKVEALHAKVMKEMGIWAPRGEILKNLIGEMVLANKLKSTSYKQAKKSVKKNKVKVASGGRSDVNNERSGRKNPSVDRNKRLGEARF